MASQQEFDELLIKHLLHETSAAEAQLIDAWLNASESNQLYLQSLAETLKLAAIKNETDKIDIDQEWQHFQQLKAAQQHSISPISEQVPVNDGPLQKETGLGKGRLYRLAGACAVAASLIFALVTQSGLFNSNTGIKKRTAINAGTGSEKMQPLMAVLLHKENKSGHIQRFSLPDGSRVVLYTNSSLTYREPSTGSSREVLLTGKADFKVAKDRNKPFTVFSGDISTTALGTRFTVTAMTHKREILVRLHEGNVVVRSTKVFTINRMKDVYLVPGQELVYDVIGGTARVRAFGKGAGGIKTTDDNRKLPNDNPGMPSFDKKPWFMFNNQSLSDIFDALGNMYDVNILYSKKDFNNMYFIGKFDKSDSVDFILKQIAGINNLEVTKDKNVYTIKIQAHK